MKELIVEIITPMGTKFKKSCTSIQFNVADNSKGNYCGSYGVRAVHAKSILAIQKGSVKVFNDGELIFNCECGDGFATVDNNTVALVVESLKEI